MKLNHSITDVRGIEVGQAQDEEALTGCTVVLCRKGAVAGVDVRGGAPGTRETDLLDPINLVQKVHAIVLAGGSAFGLEAATGVVRYLEEHKIGFNTGVAKHTFCRTCGIKPFYVPRSNPDGIDVNVHCLDTPPRSVRVAEFDGRDWERHAHTLAHKSKDPA